MTHSTNILLVSHCDFPSNSAIHVHYFANGLSCLGFDCVVYVPNDKNTVSQVGGNLYKTAQFNELELINTLFEDHNGPSLVHAWTPREHVRKFCMELREFCQFKLVVHLEDNEEQILEAYLDQPVDELFESYSKLIESNLSHPKHYREFLESADGATVIMERLKEFVPAGIPCITLWPGVDFHQFYPRSADADLLASFSLPKDATVVCYTGGVHPANAREVRGLYLAVGKRNLHDKPTVLIRTGIDVCDFLPPEETWVRQYEINLGFVERAKIPELLALADVLVQPGQSDRFNDYRFPSKIPEFLAMGKPVILPDTNIGKFLTNLENAIVLPVVNELTLSDAIDLIVENPNLHSTLTTGALRFAEVYLDWGERSQSLKDFYEKLLVNQTQTSPSG